MNDIVRVCDERWTMRNVRYKFRFADWMGALWILPWKTIIKSIVRSIDSLCLWCNGIFSFQQQKYRNRNAVKAFIIRSASLFSDLCYVSFLFLFFLVVGSFALHITHRDISYMHSEYMTISLFSLLVARIYIHLGAIEIEKNIFSFLLLLHRSLLTVNLDNRRVSVHS